MPAHVRPLRVIAPSLALVAGLLGAEEPGPARTPPPASPAPDAATTAAPDEQRLQVAGEREAEGFRAEHAQGTKLAAPLHETPQSVTALTEELVRSRGAFSLREALRSAPGVTAAAGEGGRTGDSLSIRGFTAHSDTYVDGLKDNGQYFRDVFNLERVEVLKGPSAVLFGRGATGGVVNSVTEKPTETWSGDVGVTAGTYGLLRVDAGVGGPVVEDRLGARLDAYWHEADSFRDEQHIERWGVAPTAAIQLLPQTGLLLQYVRQEEDSTMDYGVPMYLGRPADVPIDTYYGFADDSFQEFDVSTYTATLTHRFDKHVTLRNATRYATYDRSYRPDVIGAVNYTNDTVAVSQSLRRNDQENLLNQTEVAFTGRVLERRVSAMLGLEVGWEDYRFRSKNSTGVPAIDVFDPAQPSTVGGGRADDLSGPLNANTRAETSTVAGYLLGSVEVVEHWTAVLGARLDRFEAEVRSGPTTTPTVDRFETEDTMFSPRAALVWTPREELTLYASFGTSFNPSAETFGLNAATEQLDPEETRSYELGAKSLALDGALAIDLSVFRIHKTDARTTDPTNTALQTLDGEQITDGIELGFSGRITPRWNLFAGVVLLDAEVTESNTVANDTYGTPTAIEGKVPINSPEATASLWTTYALGGGFSAGGGGFYTSSRWTDAANSTKVPGYWRFDLMAAWERRAWHADWFVQLNVFNVFDEEHYEAGAARFAYPGAPLTGQLTVGLRF